MPSKAYRPQLLERLHDPDYAVHYLSEVLQNESQEAFLIALRNVVEVRGISLSSLAKQMNLTRQGLHKLLSQDGNPRLSSLSSLLELLGMKIQISEKAVA